MLSKVVLMLNYRRLDEVETAPAIPPYTSGDEGLSLKSRFSIRLMRAGAMYT